MIRTARPNRDFRPPSSTFERVNDVAAAVLLGGFLLGCTIRLWPEWIQNPDLSHGLVTPIVFVILLRETRRLPRSPSAANAFTGLGCVVCSLSGFVFFLGANLYAAALEWSHSLVLFLLSLAAASFVFAWFFRVAKKQGNKFPGWPAGVAAAIWPLSAPIPPGTYTRLTQGLQAQITEAVLFSLHLLGITAGRIGNVITLAHVSVGVEEACSGVRSLVSCVFAALFLSATFCRRAWTRFILVGISAPLALAMNFARSLILTLLANNGTNIQGFWHDATGYAILIVTALLLVLIARILEASAPTVRESAPADYSGWEITERRQDRGGWLSLFFNSAVLSVLILFVLFFMTTRPATKITYPASQDLASLLPAEAAGWTVTTRDDLYQFSSQLQTRYLYERSYLRATATTPDQLTIYVAFWPAGQAPVSLVEAHTPDACWPGSGWSENVAAHRSVPLAVKGKDLPVAEFRTFQLEGYPQNVWYWHLFDGAVIQKIGVRSPRQLLSLAWHYGFRKDGDQYFIRISSNRSWSELQDEPLMIETFARLRSTGL